MKNIWILFLLVSSSVFSQEDAWVYFTAKPNADFYYANPLEMLSQRALDRRSAQNIALDNFDIPLAQSYIDAVDNANGITVMAKSKWLNAVHVRGNFTAISDLISLSVVDHIDFADNSLDARQIPRNNTVAKKQNIQVNFEYGGSSNQIEMLNGQILHQQNYTGTGKIIAVLDAGFPEVNVAAPFQRLIDNNLILGGYNFVDRNADFYSRNSHGTLVLSTMGGYVADQLVGTAPDASYYLFITEDTSSENPVEESNWVEAAEMADSLGVDVINSSLGYFTYDNPAYSYSFSDIDGNTSFASRGAEIAFSRGMIVVISAGNTGTSANPNITVPADAEHVLTVGAVDSEEQYASFSSVGPTFDGRLKPDVMAKGLGATFATPTGNVVTGNGTSFASPILAGMVACLWQALPEKTNAQIVQLIKESANLFETPNNQYGYGIPDFSLALDNALSVPSFMQYPNPVQSYFSVKFPSDIEKAKVEIFSISGQKVQEVIVTKLSQDVHIESLQDGIYIYKISAGKNLSVGKIIKK